MASGHFSWPTMNVIEKIGGIYCNRLTLGWHYASGLWQDMAIPSNYQYAKYLDIAFNMSI
jgi:hypothetical protein